MKKKIEEKNKRLKDKFTKMEKENSDTKNEMHQLSLTVKASIEKLETLTESKPSVFSFFSIKETHKNSAKFTQNREPKNSVS